MKGRRQGEMEGHRVEGGQREGTGRFSQLTDRQQPSLQTKDFLASRITVDGKAFRQSGAHTGTFTSFEAVSESLYGRLVVRLGPGEHKVELEWRKT